MAKTERVCSDVDADLLAEVLNPCEGAPAPLVVQLALAVLRGESHLPEQRTALQNVLAQIKQQGAPSVIDSVKWGEMLRNYVRLRRSTASAAPMGQPKS